MPGEIVSQYVKFFRGLKSEFESNTGIIKKNVIILEIPDDKYSSVKEFDSKLHDGERFKFKIGDGVHTYKDLEYATELPFPAEMYFGKGNFEPWSY